MKLTPDVLQEYWSKTYNGEGKPDWSHIFPFYAETIVFQDSIQRLEGFEPFKEMCNRLSKRCKSMYMDIKNVTAEGNHLFFEWVMTTEFRRAPSTPLYGMSRLTLNEEGKITEQRDYYDLWGDIYNGIPGWRRLYRWFMRKFFG